MDTTATQRAAQTNTDLLKRWGIPLEERNIPRNLRDNYRWVAWEAVKKNNDKVAKIPVNPHTGGRASTVNPHHWGTFDQAIARYREGTPRGECSGIGLILTGADLDVGDLDRQLGDESGDVVALATAAIERAYGTKVDTYSEISPSGRGIRVISRQQGEKTHSFSNTIEGVDLYTGDGGRFVTITGKVVNASPVAHVDLTGISKFRPSEHTDADLSVPMPELLDPDDIQIPSTLSEAAVSWLLTGEHIGKSDGNGSALSCAISLYRAGLSDAEVLTLIAGSAGGEAVAGAPHRREGSPEGQATWLWKYTCIKARQHSPDRSIESMPILDDDDQDPEEADLGMFTAQDPPKQAPKKNFSFYSMAEITDRVAAPSWMVKPIIEKDTVGILFGVTGSRKSFVGVDMICAIATGRPWQGRKTKQGVCVYVCGEGAGGVGKRIAAWARTHKAAPGPVYVSKTSADLSSQEGVHKIAEGVVECYQRAKQDFGKLPLAMVVIDTLAANSGGMDENSNSEIAAAIARLGKLRDAYHCSVMLVHHVGLTDKKRERGASALRSGADWSIHCGLSGGDDTLPLDRRTVLSSVKTKDDEGFPDIELQAKKFFFHDHTDEDGVPLDTLVLEEPAAAALIAAQKAEAEALGAQQQAKAEQEAANTIESTNTAILRAVRAAGPDGAPAGVISKSASLNRGIGGIRSAERILRAMTANGLVESCPGGYRIPTDQPKLADIL